MPSDGGGGPGPPREELMMLPRYCDGGFGEVADDTDEESKDRVDKLGDRTKAACDGTAAMMHNHRPSPGFELRQERMNASGGHLRVLLDRGYDEVANSIVSRTRAVPAVWENLMR